MQSSQLIADAKKESKESPSKALALLSKIPLKSSSDVFYNETLAIAESILDMQRDAFSAQPKSSIKPEEIVLEGPVTQSLSSVTEEAMILIEKLYSLELNSKSLIAHLTKRGGARIDSNDFLYGISLLQLALSMVVDFDFFRLESILSIIERNILTKFKNADDAEMILPYVTFVLKEFCDKYLKHLKSKNNFYSECLKLLMRCTEKNFLIMHNTIAAEFKNCIKNIVQKKDEFDLFLEAIFSSQFNLKKLQIYYIQYTEKVLMDSMKTLISLDNYSKFLTKKESNGLLLSSGPNFYKRPTESKSNDKENPIHVALVFLHTTLDSFSEIGKDLDTPLGQIKELIQEFHIGFQHEKNPSERVYFENCLETLSIIRQLIIQADCNLYSEHEQFVMKFLSCMEKIHYKKLLDYLTENFDTLRMQLLGSRYSCQLTHGS